MQITRQNAAAGAEDKTTTTTTTIPTKEQINDQLWVFESNAYAMLPLGDKSGPVASFAGSLYAQAPTSIYLSLPVHK